MNNAKLEELLQAFLQHRDSTDIQSFFEEQLASDQPVRDESVRDKDATEDLMAMLDQQLGVDFDENDGPSTLDLTADFMDGHAPAERTDGDTLSLDVTGDFQQNNLCLVRG